MIIVFLEGRAAPRSPASDGQTALQAAEVWLFSPVTNLISCRGVDDTGTLEPGPCEPDNGENNALSRMFLGIMLFCSACKA
jgi:hypothetical protein